MSQKSPPDSKEGLTSKLPDGMSSNQTNEGVSSLLETNQTLESAKTNDLIGRPKKNGGNANKKRVYIAPQTELKEIHDKIGHFVSFPLKDPSTYPAKELVKSRLKQLHGTFSVKKGFDSILYIDGCLYNMISNKYSKKLCSWLKSKSKDTSIDLTVDNSTLGTDEDKTFLNRNISSFGSVISRECWEQLIEWFGGGVSVGVKCTRNQVSHGKLIRVVCGNDNSHFRRFYFNLYETIESAKKEICEVFGVDPKLARLHDYYKGNPYGRIDTEKNLALPLQSAAKLVHNNLCYLEVRTEDEEFTIKYIPKENKAYLPSDYNSAQYGYGTGARNFRSGNYFSPSRSYQSSFGFQSSGYGGYSTSKDTISGQRKEIKGTLGLNNLGNTCYMNSIIQCLSNTFLIKEPFLSKAYEADINTTNVLGYKGEVAKAFHNVMRLLWSASGSTVRPAGFKKTITDAKKEFQGFQQHDSQEFLSQLLDALHEDLNRVVKKPVTANIEANGRPDSVVAEESLTNYKMRNDSVVTDVFSGQFKSTVTCPDTNCGNVSVTFDPYMILPLPLQVTETSYTVLQVIYVPSNPEVQPFQAQVIVPKHGPVYLLRESIKEKVGITNLNAEETRIMSQGRKLKINNNANVALAVGYAENDIDVVGKRDIMIFNLEGKCLEPKPIANTADLDIFSKSKSLICYETRNYASFENAAMEPEQDWSRELKFPRQDRPATGEKAPENERYNIGGRACPFLLNDVWHGRYNHVAVEQNLRIEILGVERIDWERYQAYTVDVISKYGDSQRDVKLDKKDFARRQVFYIEAQADSKEHVEKETMYSTKKDETQFELKGIYVTSVEEDKIDIDVYKTFEETEKKKAKKKKKTDETEAVQGGLEGFANTLSPGLMEKKYLEGFFVLRPHQREIIRSTYGFGASFAKDDDTSREPIILTGSVDNSFRYIWGEFQVDMHFVKGQFICQRYESMNWNSRLVEEGADATNDEVKNWTELPETLIDTRTLVLLSHKTRGSFTQLHAGIPEAFFVPKNITESGLMEMLKARFRIYLENEFKLTGASLKEVNEETGEETDVIEQRLQSLTVKRASSKFDTSQLSAFSAKREYKLGQVIDAQEDQQAARSSDPFLFLLCEWELYPFLEARPESLYSKNSSKNEEKMTLHKALDLFSKTDRLSNRNTWYCNKCKAHKRAYKQLQLWSVPKVLVVQFKRFSQNETRMRADKLDIPVEFPFEVDLTNYTLSSKVPGASVEADIEATNRELANKYELVAISSHIGGGLGSGHYVACGKNENDGHWYKFNDSSVSKINDNNINEIVNPQAYVLFYVRKSEIESRRIVLEQRRQEAEANPVIEEDAAETIENETLKRPDDYGHRTVEPVDLLSRTNTIQHNNRVAGARRKVFEYADDKYQNEIRDNNGHFKYILPKERMKYPNKEEISSQLQDLAGKFNIRTGFGFKPTLKTNDDYFIVSTKYVNTLCKWLGDKNMKKEIPDLTVDNSDLGAHGAETLLPANFKPSSKKCQMVSAVVWNQLMQWFGGGPSIKIKCIKKKETKGKLIKVFCGNNSINFRRFYFNEYETLENIKNEVCQAFGIDPEGARFYDYFRNEPFSRLDTEDKLQLCLHQTKMMHNNNCYLEPRNEDGLFTIPVKEIVHDKRQEKVGRRRANKQTMKEIGSETSLMGTSYGLGNGIKGISLSGDSVGYLSAVIQCFANSRFFKQFFTSEAFKKDINRTNVLGFNGKIAEAFYRLLKLFDEGQGTSINAWAFRKSLTEDAKLKPSDARYFLGRFIEAIHEDLNRVIKKPITERVEANGRPDEVVASESIDSYRSRNNSIVTDLLTGFLKSTITCPNGSCDNITVSFEPYTVLPLPLKSAESAYKTMHVVFVPLNPEEQPFQTEVTVSKKGSLFMLTEALKAKLGINNLNNRELERSKNKKPLLLPQNETAKAAIGFLDPALAGKRDIMVFGSKDSEFKTTSSSTDNIEDFNEEETIICYETFNFFSYQENLNTGKRWTRDLLFQQNDSDSVELSEENKMQLGFTNCPFLLGDEWQGKYDITENHVLRLEVTEVTKMTWTEYVEYRSQVIQVTETQDLDMMLKEDDFVAGNVFQIRATVDSKRYSRHTIHSQNYFALHGLYVAKTITSELKVQQENTLNLSPSDIEKQLTHGSFLLRPYGVQNSRRNQNGRHDISKEPFTLQGSVNRNYRFMWGSYKTVQSNNTGNFTCSRHRSMNWNDTVNKKEPIVKNWTNSPRKPVDNRALVLLCYKDTGFFSGKCGVPEAFLVPTEISKGKLLVMIRARFRIYFELEFKLTGAPNGNTTDRITGEEIDEIEQLIRNLKVQLATSHFQKKKVLSLSDVSRASTSSVIYILCESNIYPFMSSRPQSILKTHNDGGEAKVRLHQSLDMLSEPRCLSEMEAWYCNKCKVHQQAYKKQEIWSLPRILIVQFDRFKDHPTTSIHNRPKKIDIAVDFPLDIDLAPYALSAKVKGKSSKSDIEKTSKELGFDYELVAVTSCEEERYKSDNFVACAKNEHTGKWYKYNRSTVTKVSMDNIYNIVNPKAYNLVYIRKSN